MGEVGFGDRRKLYIRSMRPISVAREKKAATAVMMPTKIIREAKGRYFCSKNRWPKKLTKVHPVLSRAK